MPKKKIMLVDDEPAVTRILGEFLTRTDLYTVLEVNDAHTAINSARSFHPDLIISDIIMPGMDGGEFLAALRSEPTLAAMPVLLLTGLVTETEVAARNHLVGGCKVIAKPVRGARLREVVTELLEPIRA